MQVANNQKPLTLPEQRACGMKIKAVTGEFSVFPRHWRRG